LGHSTILLQLQGVTVLFDPIFGKAASPFRFAGPQRFKAAQPIRLQDLPQVDVVCVSHDHYDHLDYYTVKRLKRTVRMFFVPLGVGAHLERWGVEPSRITELDWWEESAYNGLQFACTPSRHFSGRTLTDRFKTLWCSWAVTDGTTNIFFSGDTGYGPHFKKIGKKYGPFDLTLLECGQYDYRWPNIHMQPEQTAAAHADLHGKLLLPMHWGTFKLAFHAWSEPVERVLKAAYERGEQVTTPRIGETVVLSGAHYPTARWWEAYKS
jgi:L-ascorbate metabolism protein UlaG (beta-lactamase superfamily)